jgi:AcrR family transcriptional regulator
MVNEPIDFKEQMAETRRRQILMGAAQVFAEKGYHKATTKEIAQTAGISEGTIYNYFANKRELLLAMIELLALQSLKSIITTQPPADPKEFLTLIMCDRYQLAQERGYLIAPIIAEIFTDADLREAVYQQIVMPIASYLEQYMQAHMDAGRFRRLDPLVVTRAFVGAILLNFAVKLSGVDPRYESISADAMIEQLVSFFLDGLLQSNNDNA